MSREELIRRKAFELAAQQILDSGEISEEDAEAAGEVALGIMRGLAKIVWRDAPAPPAR